MALHLTVAMPAYVMTPSVRHASSICIKWGYAQLRGILVLRGAYDMVDRYTAMYVLLTVVAGYDAVICQLPASW